MSTLTRFKYARALPTTTGLSPKDFYSYNLKPMRQLFTRNFTWASPAAPTTIVQTFVPGSSWAEGKAILIRWAWSFTAGAGPQPAGYSITEQFQITGPSTYILPGPAPMVAPAASTGGWRELLLYRIGNTIYFADRYEALAHESINTAAGTNYFVSTGIAQPDSYFAAEIDIDLQVFENIPWGGASVAIIVSEAFLEAGTNLGTLP